MSEEFIKEAKNFRTQMKWCSIMCWVATLAFIFMPTPKGDYDWIILVWIKILNSTKNLKNKNMEATDALGNPIVLGQLYGYSQQNNGQVQIVIGNAEKVNELKVTLTNVQERKGMFGQINESFRPETRRRSVNSCHLFKI